MAFTKVVGPGIHTQSNIVSHNINSSGIITATQFDGPFSNVVVGGATTLTVDGINISAGILTAKTLDLNGNGDISGNLVLGGDLTVNGTTTTLDTNLIGVDRVEVLTTGSNVGIAVTQNGTADILRLYDGSNKEFSVADGGTVYVSQQMAFQQSDRATTAGLLGRGSLLLAGTQQTDFAIRSVPHNSNLVLGVGVTERLRITSTGAVGIATATPIGDFTVLTEGNGYFGIDGGGGKGAEFNVYHKDTKANTFKLANNGGTNELAQYALTSTSGKHIWHIGGTVAEKMRLTTTGLGIGTDNPGQHLEVYGTGTSTQVEVNGTGRYRGFEIHEAGTRKAYFHHDSTDNIAMLNTAEANLQFYTGDTYRMKLDGNGDLTFKDAAAQGNSLQSKITVTDSSNNIQYEIGMLSTGNEDLYFSNSRNSNIRFRTSGSTRWYIDGDPGHLLPETAGAVNIGSASAEIGHVYLGDDKRLQLGSDQDMLVYHDNTHGYVSNRKNNLYLQAPNYVMITSTDTSGSNMQTGARFLRGGSSEIYHSNSLKFETTGIGVSVHGEVAATQDYPNQRPALDFNFAQEKVLDPRLMFARDGDASYYDEFGVVRFAGRNEPRFDHDPVTRESKGLLMEKEKTNWFPYGTTPGDLWNSSKSGTFEEYTTETTAPDGTFTATKWTFTNSDPYLYHTHTLSANYSYTVSMWVKAGTNMAGDYLQIRIGGAPYSPNGDDITIPADGTWKRVSYTKTVGGSNETNVNVGFEPQVNPSGNPASGDVIYIWGAQLETNHFMSSFIPTNGASKTRYQDTLKITGDDVTDVFNTTEGTMFYEASITNLANDNQPIVTFNDRGNSSGNEIAMGYRTGGGSSGNIRTWMRSYVTGSQVNSFLSNHGSTGMIAGKPYRHIFGFKKDDAADSYNTGANSAQTTDTSGNLPVAGSIDQLRFGSYYNESSITQYPLESGHIKRFSYWPVRLTNTQLTTYIA